jgi:hypothetical protein
MFQVIRKLLLTAKARIVFQRRQPIWKISKNSHSTKWIISSHRLKNITVGNHNAVYIFNHSVTDGKYKYNNPPTQLTRLYIKV